MMRRILLAVAVMAAWSSSAAAQQSRADLLRSAQTAYDDFAPERALDLLKAATNPALGPTDTAWVRGVHLLTQILVEGGNQDLAKTWSRWAARLAPGMAIDTVNFLASAVSTLREARTFSSARTSGDAVTRTSWRWVGRGSSETRGRIVVEAAAMPVAVNVRVVGGALVPPGAGLSLAPGSYEIEAGAPGFLPARVTREVMPGVTTVVAFSLTSAAVASDVIAENVRRRFFANIAPLSVRRFGASAPACAGGAFVSRDGLVLTSYQAIRGADGITSTATLDARGVRVAAYDVAGDMAVLHLPGTRTDSIALSSTVVEGQSAWAVRFADCATPAEVRVRVSAWTDRPLGNLQLSDQPQGAAAGSPLVDVSGALAGVWAQGLSAIPATKAADLIAQARRNVAQQQLIAVADLSRRENHAYGSAIIASEALGTTVKVTPLEPWQWERVAASARTPYLFVGPMGRYRVEVSSATGARREQEITIRPGVEQRLMVALNAVAMVPEAATNIAKPKRRSRLPWVLAAVGGGGLAAAVALGGGGTKGNNGPPTSPPSTGSISVRVPVNPP